MLFLQSKKSFLYQTTAVADQMFQMNSYKECRWTVLFYDSAAQMEIHRWFSMTLQHQAATSLQNWMILLCSRQSPKLDATIIAIIIGVI
jgi:hypothetical protein